jgi:hypothetical protein
MPAFQSAPLRGKEKIFPRSGKEKKFRVAEKDWNAGAPPASVLNRTEQV